MSHNGFKKNPGVQAHRTRVEKIIGVDYPPVELLALLESQCEDIVAQLKRLDPPKTHPKLHQDINFDQTKAKFDLPGKLHSVMSDLKDPKSLRNPYARY